jgi:thiopurine S-methyltransferase
MIWLAKQGYEVIGVELSPIAVKAFFQENRLQPVKRRQGHFTLWQHGNITVLCGDYFSLTKAHLGHIDMVYDRAALTALPEPIRGHYVAQLLAIVPETTDVFLLTIEDAEENETTRQVLHVDEEVKSLYSEGFEINLAHVDSVLELDPESPNQTLIATDYKVYILSGR